MRGSLNYHSTLDDTKSPMRLRPYYTARMRWKSVPAVTEKDVELPLMPTRKSLQPASLPDVPVPSLKVANVCFKFSNTSFAVVDLAEDTN
jgi:hypothetical protein